MKPDKHFASAAVVAIAAVCLIALTWIGTIQMIRVQRAETINRTTATLANEALTFAEQINRQILGFDQTLRMLAAAWEADPRGFNLDAWRRQASVLDGLSRDMVLTDENGIIRQSSVVEAINQNASGLDYFRVLSDPSEGDRLYIGPAAIDGIMRQWHMNVARALHHPDGSFAGVIDADYRIAAITDIFRQTLLGRDTFFALAGLEDGKLRGAVSAMTTDPDVNISETPMFAAIAAADSGIWTGPSANDAVRRIHAFRHVPGRKFAVVVAVGEDEVLRSIKTWRREEELAAGVITLLVTGLAIVLIQATRLARRSRAQAVEAQAALAAANAQFEVARALALAKAEQLQITLAGMSDGVLMIDAHLCLVEWNAHFPELAGVPADILRVGMPLEEMLRAQIRAGEFGPIEDAEAEVARGMAHLSFTPVGATPPAIERRQRPDGQISELRRNRLPDGGFVIVYTDITEHERAEEALRAARAAVATANADKARFLAMVRHETGTPLNALQNAIQLLANSLLAPAQRSLLTIAQQASDTLTGVIGDVLDTSRSDVSIRPSHVRMTLPIAALSDDLIAGTADTGFGVVAEVEIPPVELPRPALRRTRVLLVGDLSASQAVTATVLRREGHHVDRAPNGTAAIEALRARPYDLVLIDLVMPGLDGRETVDAIRAMADPVRTTPIVALTANAGTVDEEAVKAAGLDSVLSKPVSLPELLDVLRVWVWTRAEAQNLTAPGSRDTGRTPVPPALSSRRINELRAAIPAATLISTVEECLVDMDRRLPALRRSLAARAPGAISAHAQAMIGMAAAYGMVALEGRLRSIAAAVRDGELSSLDATMAADLDRDFELAALSLREILRTETV